MNSFSLQGTGTPKPPPWEAETVLIAPEKNQEAIPAKLRPGALNPGDITTTKPGYLTIGLQPLPTKAMADAVVQLCDRLNSTQTRYPGTELILHHGIKKHA